MDNGLKKIFFYEWYLSRIFEIDIPSNWTVEYLDKSIEIKNSFYYSNKSLFSKLSNRLPFLKLINGFYRVYEVYGFKFYDFVRFNCILSSKKVNLNLSNHKKYKTYKEQINWKYDIEKLLNQVTTKFNLNLPSYIKKIKRKNIKKIS